MYKKCYQGKKLDWNLYEMHLWESDDKHQIIQYENIAYVEDKDSYTCKGLNGELLKPTINWRYSQNEKYKANNTPNLHFHDMKVHQKFLIERYGTNDVPSTGHKELFFDIECEMLDSFEVEEIEKANKVITSIAFWNKQTDDWGCLILDPKGQVPETKEGKIVLPFKTEYDLLFYWVQIIQEIRPDIIIGYNSDNFDMPYLYYRICNVCGKEVADQMSPLYDYVDEPVKSKKYSQFFYKSNMFVDILGIEPLDYMRLHKKYSWKDEPSWKLDAIGEKYAGVNKIEYDGNLDQLFETDIHKFIQYNFRDVEILKLLDEKLQYLALTKNLSHKGKHNYSEVYSNSVTQDGAISAYILHQGLIPPPRHKNAEAKKGYAGGYLFCPKAGLYKYMFDEDLTSLYPSIIMSLNIGRETFKGRIIDADDRNNRLGLNDLKERDPQEKLLVENKQKKQAYVPISKLIQMIEENNLSISANGAMFSTDNESYLSSILNKWFDERVKYKDEMKKAFKAGNKEEGESFYMKQYTMKILLNSLYGATALPGFRYGLPKSILSEAITLTGWRIIQESALCANRHMNKVLRGEITL